MKFFFDFIGGKSKYLVSIYSTTRRRIIFFLGERMSTNTNSKTNRTLKYLVIEEKKLSKRLDRLTLYW